MRAGAVLLHVAAPDRAQRPDGRAAARAVLTLRAPHAQHPAHWHTSTTSQPFLSTTSTGTTLPPSGREGEDRKRETGIQSSLCVFYTSCGGCDVGAGDGHLAPRAAALLLRLPEQLLPHAAAPGESEQPSPLPENTKKMTAVESFRRARHKKAALRHEGCLPCNVTRDCPHYKGLPSEGCNS